MRTAESIAEVVENGLCIGCGLCEALTAGRVSMRLTSFGALRPDTVDRFTPTEEAALLAACPGVVAAPRPLLPVAPDPVWGAHGTMCMAWAADPTIRYEAATGGVLTALGVFLLESGQVDAVLHVGQRDGDGFANRWVISETPADVVAHKGSRYSPTSPLAGLAEMLGRGVPFALIAKPCDAGAVHALSEVDERVDELCRFRLTMVCGGQSRLTKSLGVAEGFGLAADDVDSIRYRGFGNPGPTVLRSRAGNEHTVSYLDMWADEGTWDLDARCTVCPDPLGEASDVAAADAWPGGAPVGEDEGFNAIVVRSPAGETLIHDAVDAGHLVLGDPITPAVFNDMQPHQVRKKQALTARFAALAAADKPIIETEGLRLDENASAVGEAARQAEIDGTAVRIGRGRYTEPRPPSV